jgi:hypothetical protein
MTDEHLPARSAGNADPINEMLGPGEAPDQRVLRSWANGLALPTLCEHCNGNGTRWRYVSEYARWREAGVKSLDQYCRMKARYAPAKLVPGELIALRLNYDRMAGRFARYVIGMFLAAQRSPDLVLQHPQLLRAVEPVPGGEVPGPFDMSPARLFLAFANRRSMLMTDTAFELRFGMPGQRASGLVVPAAASNATGFRVMVFSPFAVTLITSGDDLPLAGFDISGWTQRTHHQRIAKTERRVQLPAFGLSVGHD